MTRRQHRQDRQRGVTLIELMVGMAIGLIVTLAVSTIVLVGENHKRATLSLNDANQSGSFGAYLLDRALRSSGSGITQAWDKGVFGCRLNVVRNSTQLLPRSQPFPAPFADVPQALRVAPVLIQRTAGSSSDVLITMGGNAAAGDIPRPVLSASGTDLRLHNTLGLSAGDLALLSRGMDEPCLMEQVQTADPAAGNEVLTLGGAYVNTGSSPSLATLTGTGEALFSPLGRAEAGNVQFQMFTADAQRQLVQYDLLQSPDQPQPLADGVAALRAMYALDANNDGKFEPDGGVDRWVQPDEAGYDLQSMMDTPAKARQVLAVRIALVLRTAYAEKPAVTGQYLSPASLELFGDLALPAGSKVLFSIAEADREFRHRVVELTVPLRNMLILPTS